MTRTSAFALLAAVILAASVIATPREAVPSFGASTGPLRGAPLGTSRTNPRLSDPLDGSRLGAGDEDSRPASGAPSATVAAPVAVDTPVAATTNPRLIEPKLAAPLSAVTGTGNLSWMPERYGSDYLALPIGRGHRVRLCSLAGCVTMTSNDAGPALGMQRAGRVADVGVLVWERITGLDRRFGLAPGSWTIVADGPIPTAPPTDLTASDTPKGEPQ